MVYTIYHMDNNQNVDTLNLAQSNALKREIMDTEEKISKLQSAKSNRKAVSIIGIILISFYIYLYVSATTTTANDPASVSFLIPFFLFPIVLIGIFFILFGISGIFIIQSRIEQAEKHLKLINESIAV
jgi:formate/nitrite transporter FocA (FNT family)